MKPDLKHRDTEKPRRGGGLLWFVAGGIVAVILIFAVPAIRHTLEHAKTSTVEHAKALNKSLHEKTTAKPAKTSAGASAAAPRFDFYQLLKHPTQILTSHESDEVKGEPDSHASVTQSGSYILQVASLRNGADAEKFKAQLALWGISSHVQKVKVQKETWHRVRIGPVKNLAKLNALREKLAQHHIKPLLIRVAD